MIRRSPALGLALAATCLLIGTSCQRALGDKQLMAYRDARAAYPWQMPAWGHQLHDNGQGQQDSAAAPGGAVELPTDKGHHPAFDAKDTLDTRLLAGDWLIDAFIGDEKTNLVAPSHMSIFKFAADGTFALLSVDNGEVQKTSNGTWEKAGPGRMLVSYGGNSPYTFYAEMDGPDFLFLWTFEGQNGLWLVRRPEHFTPIIQAGDFTFTNGDHLSLKQVGADSFAGTIDGPAKMEVTGGYSQGVINLRWVDRLNNADGFAEFVVSPDWKELRGVSWLSDFTSAPFAEHWETSPRPVAPPDTTAPPPPGSPDTAPPVPPAQAPPVTPPPASPPPPAVPPAGPPPAALPPGSQA